MLESFLQEWLRACGYDEPFNIENTTISLGRVIFSIECEQPTLNEVYACILDFFPHLTNEILAHSIFIVLEACLICASQSDDKTIKLQYVQPIMKLSSECKKVLMEAIKNRMEKYTDSDLQYDDCINAVNLSLVEGRFPEACRVCDEKDLLADKLLLEKERISNEYRDLEQRLRGDITKKLNDLVDAELRLVEKDEIISGQSQVIQKLEFQCIESNSSVESLRAQLASISAIQDEVDILRSQVGKVDQLEERNTLLKDKLELLRDVEKQLKLESKALADIHEELLAVKIERDELRKCKSQVDDYRREMAEQKIQNENNSLRLQQQQEELTRLKAMNESLTKGQREHRAETTSLADELLATKSHLQLVEKNGSIAEGISELNPALMQELHRLRSDNKTLLLKVEATSEESLNRLERELEDSKCMVSSLQQKWLSATDSLVEANRTIDSLRQLQFQLEAEIILLNETLEDTKLKNTQKCEATRAAHMDAMAAIEMKHYEETVTLTASHATALDQLMSQLTATQTSLLAAEADVKSLNECKNHLEASLQLTQEKLAKEITARKESIESHRSAVQRMTVEHDSQITAEQEKVRSLTADLESEKMKRRRVERERKLLDEEVHKAKMQLQVAGTGSGHDVEAALQELKMMQQQLNAAENEVHRLRSGGAICSSGSAPSSLSSHSTSGVVVMTSAAPGTGTTSNKTEPTRALPHSTSRSGTGSAGGISSNGIGAASRILPGSGVSHSTTNGIGSKTGFQESVDLNERKIAQMQKERRELIAKNLEDNKEKHDLAQQLLQSEEKVKAMRRKVTDIELEKERMERKYQKILESVNASVSLASTASENRHPNDSGGVKGGK